MEAVEMSEREQLRGVVLALGITIESKRITNAYALNDYMKTLGAGASHWTVTLRRGRFKVSTSYHMGSAHKGTPDATDVLSSLLIDANAGEQSFDDHCADFGLSRDSRAEHAAWKACRDMAPKVRRFLGAHFDRAASAEH
jgi:hypothetical protein